MVLLLVAICGHLLKEVLTGIMLVCQLIGGQLASGWVIDLRILLAIYARFLHIMLQISYMYYIRDKLGMG